MHVRAIIVILLMEVIYCVYRKCEVFLGKIDTESEMKNKLQQRLKDLEKEIPSLQRKQKQLKTDRSFATLKLYFNSIHI